jgi:hypothetical protein
LAPHKKITGSRKLYRCAVLPGFQFCFLCAGVLGFKGPRFHRHDRRWPCSAFAFPATQWLGQRCDDGLLFATAEESLLLMCRFRTLTPALEG